MVDSATPCPKRSACAASDLSGIDAIVAEGIKAQAYPGLRSARGGGWSSGHEQGIRPPTYEKKRAVRPDDLYDLASITKVASTTLALMKSGG